SDRARRRDRDLARPVRASRARGSLRGDRGRVPGRAAPSRRLRCDPARGGEGPREPRLRADRRRSGGGTVSSPERRRFPRRVPAGPTVAMLVTERRVAHGRLLDVSLAGARVRLDPATPVDVVTAPRAARDHGARIDLVSDDVAGPRRARVVWLETGPDA